VDYFLFPPPHELARLRQLPGVTVTTRGREGFAGIVTVIPNLRSSTLSHPKVRQAIAYAIDRGVILDKVYFGNGLIATGPISWAVGWAYNPELPRYERDLSQANRLLDEAGYPRGPWGMHFPLSIQYDASFAKLAEVRFCSSALSSSRSRPEILSRSWPESTRRLSIRPSFGLSSDSIARSGSAFGCI
jgi:peptide/nickel transport system substrate-binding protein